MRRDLLKKAIQSAVPPVDFGTSPAGGRRRGKRNGKSTKTTIAALHYGIGKDKGILCAADRKTTAGWSHIWSIDSVKIYQVSATSLLLGCGNIGDIQFVRDRLERWCDSWQRSHDIPLSVYAQANFVGRWCRWMYTWLSDFSFGGIIAGMDPDSEFVIYDIDEDGGRIKHDRYASNGSGGANAKVILDKVWKPAMDRASAQRLAVDALFHAGARDNFSSDIRIALPTVAVVTKKGIMRVTDKDVMTDVAQVLLNKMGIHLDLAKALVRAQRGRR